MKLFWSWLSIVTKYLSEIEIFSFPPPIVLLFIMFTLHFGVKISCVMASHSLKMDKNTMVWLSNSLQLVTSQGQYVLDPFYKGCMRSWSKSCVVITWKVTIRSSCKFACAWTAELPWHVQNYYVTIRKYNWNKILAGFQLSACKPFLKWSLCEHFFSLTLGLIYLTSLISVPQAIKLLIEKCC